MAVELEDSSSGVTLPLWNAQELRREHDAAVDVYSTIISDAGEAFLTSLEQEGAATLSGEVTAGRLVQDNRFSNTRRKALGEWAATFESFVNGGQGDGYTLRREYVGDTFDGVIDSMSWTTRGGEPDSLDWNLSFIRGGATSVGGAPSYQSAFPGGDWEIDGTPIDYPSEFQVEISQEYEVYRRALAESVGDNDLFPESGPVRRITIIADVVGDEATREAFYDGITSSFAQNETVFVRDGLTARALSGMISSFDTTDEAGLTRLGEFSMEIVSGVEQ